MAAANLKEIAEHIRHMRFRPKLFGGVDEADVWKKIEQLDEDYRNLFRLQNQIYKMELARLKQARAVSGKKTADRK